MPHYDAIIIGAGQAGGPLATALGQSGRKTAIIEREHVGGTCINEGCTPTKTMVASAQDAYMARRGADYGVNTGPISVDMTVVRKRKRDIVNSFRNGSQSRLEKSENVDLLMGEASFVAPKSLDVHMNDGSTQQLTSDLIFINTGECPSTPQIQGLEEVPYLDSTSIMELDVVPKHLIVVGGGYIGLEFGQMFRRFGSNVTIVQRGKQLLKREDPDIAEEVEKILREDGVEVLLETNTSHVTKDADGTIHLTVKTGDGQTRTIDGTHLLAGTGRMPNTSRLNLSVTGVETDSKGYIKVNDTLETNVSGIYALGDVKGPPAFTHISYDDFRIIRTNVIEHGHASIKNRIVPYTVFIDPQLGRVGISETEAKQQGVNYKVAKMPMNYVARALEVDEPRGMMKAIVDPDTKQILGCAVLGIEGGEVMAMLQIAMMGKVPYTMLEEGIFAHPTLAESLNTLFGMVE
jgi:pyruvate/2-oxoglutarate dehydrogenase complex dihydrolipoamide dehydrogenase (E3) component